MHNTIRIIGIEPIMTQKACHKKESAFFFEAFDDFDVIFEVVILNGIKFE